ncbi:MAG: hypothetical protein K2X87_31730 [Gemmataceae bacterium]|nr:hypothetical protein [Gemmataceae bacterium]
MSRYASAAVIMALTVGPAQAQPKDEQGDEVEYKAKGAAKARPPKPAVPVAPPPVPAPAAAGGMNGPPEPYVYTNAVGVFKLSTEDGKGVARYSWQGRQHEDELRFVQLGQVATPGPGIPKGQAYDVWIYEATDAKGNVWYLAFGVDPLRPGGGVPPGRYGLYYSRVDPAVGGKLSRWTTPTGTERQ